MRRVANSRAELKELALRMRNADHGARRLVAENDFTTTVIGPDRCAHQRHTSPICGAIERPLSPATLAIDTSVTCRLEAFKSKVYSVEVKRLSR